MTTLQTLSSLRDRSQTLNFACMAVNNHRRTLNNPWTVDRNCIKSLLPTTGFTVKILKLTVKILTFSIKLLTFTVKLLTFTVKLLGFTVKILGFTVKLLGFTVKIL
ncbi:MAG: hypothetical protein AB4352_29455 [Hormoscilla sp.]